MPRIPWFGRDAIDPRARHDSRTIANVFIGRGIEHGNPKTPMQVLKLVYFAHGWMLGTFGVPLCRQPFEAWRHGPVSPDIYHSIKSFGKSPVTTVIGGFEVTPQVFGNDDQRIFEHVTNNYDKYSGLELSHFTHWPDSPWFETCIDRGLGAVIPNDWIEEYFAKLRNRRAS